MLRLPSRHASPLPRARRVPGLPQSRDQAGVPAAGRWSSVGRAAGAGEGGAAEVPQPAPSGPDTYQEACDFSH